MADAEIDDEPITQNRRRSIFNRTSNENVTINCTRDIPEVEEQIMEEYCEDLKQEIENWKQILNECRQRNAYLKGKLRTDLKEYADLNILSDEEKNFIKAAPSYSAYIKSLEDTCKAAEIVACEKHNYENCRSKFLFETKLKINTINAILTKIL